MPARDKRGRFREAADPSSLQGTEENPVARRRADQCVLDGHRQKYPSSGNAALVELCLKLAGETPPDLQAEERESRLSPLDFAGRPLGTGVLRPLTSDAAELRTLIARHLEDSGPLVILPHNGGARGWVAVALMKVGPHGFVELWRKGEETGQGESQFSEKKLLALDALVKNEEAIVLRFDRAEAAVPVG